MNLESLLISRDAALLGVLQPTLEKISVSVEVCPECRTGFALLAKKKFDAVVIDCDDMPDGIDLLSNMRTASSNSKSVAFAVLNGKTTTQVAFQRGANFVLQKPLTPLHASRCFNAALNFMVRERRRYFRFPIEIPVHLRIPHNQEIAAITTNLSEGGMAIRIPAKLLKDTPLALRFKLPVTNITLELKGQVAWIDGTRQAGIRFVEVPQSSQYQLDKWLTDRLREEMPNNLVAHSS